MDYKGWYNLGMEKLLKELSDYISPHLGLNDPDLTAQLAYGFLSEINIIDYDIEKEVIYARYCDDE